MGLFKGLTSLSPFSGVGLLKPSGGQNTSDAILSGIPILGEGFAAQQQQNFSAAQSSAKMQFEAEQAQNQMNFQERMANTAHQREIADLKAAGLNPMLSGTGGSGAATPSGAMGSGSAAQGSYGSGAGSSAKMLQSMLNLERDEAKSRIGKNQSDTAYNEVAQNVQRAQENLINTNAKSAAIDVQNKKLEQEALKVDAEYQKNYGTFDRMMNTFGKFMNGAGALKQLFKGGGTSRKLPPHYKVDKRTGELY